MGILFSARNRSGHSGNHGGFTVVELMIASLVFSTILVVVTAGVIKFTNSYYRGANASSVQATSQNAIDIISQSIQFSSAGTNPGGSGYFCAGGKEFIYTPGIKYSGGTASLANAGLYMIDNPSPTCPVPTSAMMTGGTQLLGRNMRVVFASVTTPDATNKYLSVVKIKIAYGGADLLCSRALGTGTGGCAVSAADYSDTSAITAEDTTCKGEIGSQFCAVAGLSNVVQQRLVL